MSSIRRAIKVSLVGFVAQTSALQLVNTDLTSAEESKPHGNDDKVEKLKPHHDEGVLKSMKPKKEEVKEQKKSKKSKAALSEEDSTTEGSAEARRGALKAIVQEKTEDMKTEAFDRMGGAVDGVKSEAEKLYSNIASKVSTLFHHDEEAAEVEEAEEAEVLTKKGHKASKKKHEKVESLVSTAHSVEKKSKKPAGAISALARHKVKEAEISMDIVKSMHKQAVPRQSVVAPQINLLRTTEDKAGVHIPPVKELMGKSHSIIKRLNEHMSMLNTHLKMDEERQREGLTAQKAKYEANISAEIKKANVTEQHNDKLMMNISALTKENSQLRSRAMQLKESSTQLVKEIETLSANLTSVQDYVDESLVESENHTERMAVLRELDAKDDVKKTEKAYKKRLAKVGPAMSLLQFDVEANTAGIELVDDLQSKVEILEQSKSAAMGNLTAVWEQDLIDVKARQVSLVEEEEELELRQQAALALREKLGAAVKHLDKADKYLQNQVKGVQGYMMKSSK